MVEKKIASRPRRLVVWKSGLAIPVVAEAWTPELRVSRLLSTKN
jgi:hypothetical protein